MAIIKLDDTRCPHCDGSLAEWEGRIQLVVAEEELKVHVALKNEELGGYVISVTEEIK